MIPVTNAFLSSVYLIFIIFPINKASGSLSSIKKSFWNAVFFNDLLIIFVEGYIEFSLAAFLLYDAPPGHNDRDNFTISIVVCTFFLSNIAVPGLMLWILLTKDLETINEEKFMQKWDSRWASTVGVPETAVDGQAHLLQSLTCHGHFWVLQIKASYSFHGASVKCSTFRQLQCGLEFMVVTTAGNYPGCNRFAHISVRVKLA